MKKTVIRCLASLVRFPGKGGLVQNAPSRVTGRAKRGYGSRILLFLALASLAMPALAARVRVVRHPAEACSFSVVPAWGTAPVAAAGVTRAMLFIYGQTANCAQWNAYSSVPWVTVEAAPMDAQPAAYVTVAANPLSEARVTTLIIAGVRFELAQEAAPTLTNTNLVANGNFNTNISTRSRCFTH